MQEIENPIQLDDLKRKAAKKFKSDCPSNISLLKYYHSLVKNKRIKKSKKTESFLKTRPVRSLSGIVNISVLTKPFPCPGKCIYCPQEKNIPKSYLSGEPAVERAKRLKYDPFIQVKKRIQMLKEEGHPTDKIDMRIIGGTWSFYAEKYRYWFIKRCFDGCNNKKTDKKYKYFSLKELKKQLAQAKRKNQSAKHRMIGLSVETRPDFIDIKEIEQLREFGVTKVEIGIQSIYKDVLKMNKRGHNLKKTINATKMLKNAGFKIAYQMMLNLLGSTPKKDIKMFKELFKNPDFKPDYLKIYPCALVKESGLYNLYLKKKYKPYSKDTLVKIISEIKKDIPYYVRIERIIRDIPAQKIVEGGAKTSNLRQIIERKMKIKCKCIRCREVKKDYNPEEKTYMFRENYESSKGKEIFLTFENKERTKLYSLLRLRVPNLKNHFLKTLQNSSIVREVHTYGQMIPVSSQRKAIQHKGLGKKLIEEAENITKKEYSLDKISVISGVGVREYYQKLGYKLKNEYMVKLLL